MDGPENCRVPRDPAARTRGGAPGWGALACVVVVAVFLASTSEARPVFEFVDLGLEGSEYQRADGYRNSEGRFLNGEGKAAGYTSRFVGSEAAGSDVWYYDGAESRRIGLTGAGYERTDGYRYGALMFLNDAGRAGGYALRFAGMRVTGEDAWLFDGAETRPVGLTGKGYERADGYRRSVLGNVNEFGAAVGYSSRYRGGQFLGEDAWLDDGTQSRRIGLTGGVSLRVDGYRSSLARYLNNSGQSAGTSARFAGIEELGQDAWFDDGARSHRIGLSGAAYARADGYRYNAVSALNGAGQVSGTTSRYVGSEELGQDAWLFDGTGTFRIGLVGAAYTRADGYRVGAVAALNEVGQVAGTAYRFGGSAGLGQDAWLYGDGVTTRIGLLSDGYERADGYARSSVFGLNDAGQVAGTTERYVGSDALGQDAWFFDGTESRPIGLTDGDFERSDGYRFSTVSFMNDTGQAAGFSRLFFGNEVPSNVAWLYDVDTDQTFSFALSTRASDGYAYSEIHYLDDTGLALGAFELFDESTGASLGSRAFQFSLADGVARILDTQFVDAFGEYGWDYLAEVIKNGLPGPLLASAVNPAGGLRTYLLIPATSGVPEPAPLVSIGVALFALAVVTLSRRFAPTDAPRAAKPIARGRRSPARIAAPWSP